MFLYITGLETAKNSPVLFDVWIVENNAKVWDGSRKK